MSPAEWVAEQTSRIRSLEEWRTDTKDPAAAAVLESEIAETRRIRDDFIEFAEQAYGGAR